MWINLIPSVLLIDRQLLWIIQQTRIPTFLSRSWLQEKSVRWNDDAKVWNIYVKVWRTRWKKSSVRWWECHVARFWRHICEWPPRFAIITAHNAARVARNAGAVSAPPLESRNGRRRVHRDLVSNRKTQACTASGDRARRRPFPGPRPDDLRYLFFTDRRSLND